MPDTASRATRMRHRLLGRSGIRISELCLGSMTFGAAWPGGADEAAAREIYAAYREAGGNFVDTANLYTDGESEAVVGRLVAAERDSVVLATKFTLPTDADDPNSGGSHRKSLRRGVETSLRRLGTDYLDLLWVHAWDQCTPGEETLRALDDLVRSGKVLAIGVSNTPAWVVARSQAIAELRGWSAFCALQVEYSLAARSAEREFLPMAKALDLAVTAWSPLARGLLAGKAPRSDGGPARRRQAVEVCAEIAAELGTTSPRVALGWLLRRGVVPVLGASKPAQVRDNLGASAVRALLDEAQVARLDAATRVSPGYPYEFLAARCPTLAAPQD